MKRLGISRYIKKYAVFLDGVDDYMVTPTSDLLNITLDLTIITVFELLSLDNDMAVVDRKVTSAWDTATYYLCLLSSTKKARFIEGSGGGEFYTYDSIEPVVVGKINRVAVRRKSDVITFYVNGVWNEKTRAKTDPAYGGSQNLLIGKERADRYYLHARMHALMIYNRYLSDWEVEKAVFNPHNPPKNGLVLYFYDKVTEMKWIDESGNKLDADFYGAIRRYIMPRVIS